MSSVMTCKSQQNRRNSISTERTTESHEAAGTGLSDAFNERF